MPELLCFGFGFSAQATERRLGPLGWNIFGTARTPQGVEAVMRSGVAGGLFDGNGSAEAVTAALRSTSHLLVSIPPGADGFDPVLKHHRDDLMHAPALQAIVYLSTVGVYGDAGGQWVDETSPTRPLSGRSKARLAAENAWLDLGNARGCRVSILRLAGIYGPGRSAIDNVRAGTARRIIKPGQVFNRVHVEDVAAAAVAALTDSAAQGVYNVADDEPSPPQDVILHAANLLGVAPPPEVAFSDAQLSPMAASFYGEVKRVHNRRLREELGVRLQFPTYREGLAQVLAATDA